MSVLDDFARAIENDDSITVQSMIDSGAVDVNARLSRTRNPPALVHAVFHNQREIVNTLLRANARIDDVDDCGQTACHVAAKYRAVDVDLLALLLARRPNLAILDSTGSPPLEYSLIHCESERKSLLLLESGASLNGVTLDGLVRFASMSTAAIQALLDRGVVVSKLRDEFGATPLHWAARRRSDRAVLSMLVNVCGVDLEMPDFRGHTCAFDAAVDGHIDPLRWLVAAGADITRQENELGSTSLHSTYNYECLIVLLAAGAGVNARSDCGRTAAHLAVNHFVTNLALQCVHALLAGGACLDIEDNFGRIVSQRLVERRLFIRADQVDAARRDIAKARLDFVRSRALQVCIGLQPLDLDALQLCEILQFACGPVAPLVPFHQWWKIATTVKHFLSRLGTVRIGDTTDDTSTRSQSVQPAMKMCVE